MVETGRGTAKQSTIAVRPFFDNAVSNMGLENYGLSLYDGVKHFEQLACLENNGVIRYLTGLNEFAPEIKLLQTEDRQARIKEIRTAVAELEKELAANVLDIEDPQFWNQVKLLKPDNKDFWNRINIACGNGGYIYTMANRQMQEIMKTKPTFVVLVTVLSLFYGDFKVTDPDYTNWYAAYNKIIKEVVNYGGIPVMIKWPPGPYTNNNTTQWNAFIDAEVLLNPTMQVLDLTGYSFTYSDNSHPSAADYQLILQSVDALLAANGY